MRKKGFTLIELLAVIVLLGILLSLSIVAINNIKKKQDLENEKNVISSILTGAKRYVADHPDVLDFSSHVYVYIDVDSTFINNYADFDENKYSNFKGSGLIKVDRCPTNEYKLKYTLEKVASDGNTYNDCGCELQTGSNSNKLCN